MKSLAHHAVANQRNETNTGVCLDALWQTMEHRADFYLGLQHHFPSPKITAGHCLPHGCWNEVSGKTGVDIIDEVWSKSRYDASNCLVSESFFVTSIGKLLR